MIQGINVESISLYPRDNILGSRLLKYNIGVLINLRNSTNSIIFVRVIFRISRMCAQRFLMCVNAIHTLLQFDRRQVMRLIVIVLITILFMR